MKTDNLLILSAILSITFMKGQEIEIQNAYDHAGNQIKRQIVLPSRSNDTIDEITNLEYPGIDELSESELQNGFTVSPNPTSGVVTLHWKPEFQENILSIELVSLLDSSKTPIVFSKSNQVDVDISNRITGIYIVIFYLNHPKTRKVQKKIIKI